jgi:hypothetical protein
MKNWILRASAAAFAAGLMGSLACGGSSSGCGGGSNINANDSSATQLNVQCGAGTYLNNHQCVPMPTATSNATPAAAAKVATH